MTQKISISIMAIFFVVAGINHFVNTDMYLKIVPDYIPWHLPVVYISGVAEIGLGVLLLVPRTRKWAAFGIIGLLVAVFPANIFMLTSQATGDLAVDWPYWLRLPLQAVLIYWVWLFTKDNEVKNEL